MNILKSSLIVTASALVLAGCGGVAPLVSTPVANIDTIPLKITDITDMQMKAWTMADLATDTIPGMSVDRAYSELLKGKKGKQVIVAVIDSGIDIEHEDLKNVIWTNPKEIAGNGKDDDKNGYIDDIHGWNFLGDIVAENLEYVRIVKKYDAKYKGKTAASIPAGEKATFAMYQKANAELQKEIEQTNATIARYNQMIGGLKPAHDVMTKKLGKEDYSKSELLGIKDATEEEQQQIGMLSQMFAYAETIPEFFVMLNGAIESSQGRADTHFNIEADFRGVLGDNVEDITDTNYGNNDVDGPDPKKEDAMHGTHVAGSIAAQRNNGIGMDGIADNVKIMVVRAVPDGDEYDKDIALAIRYAADNGAKVINTSFGKYYSMHPEWVWDAIKYAGTKDVLIVNAAGNEGIDLDGIQVYPNDQELTGGEISDNFLTVGALNYKYGSELVANFSNYGKTSVDVFGPGVKIWSTVPLNEYRFLQGTSMASPNVAGVAAMIRSHYPKLSAKQVKQVLMDSGISTKTAVILGGDPSNTNTLPNVSTSGKMVNMYNALIMASKM